jgi:hypothetical protein
VLLRGSSAHEGAPVLTTKLVSNCGKE